MVNVENLIVPLSEEAPAILENRPMSRLLKVVVALVFVYVFFTAAFYSLSSSLDRDEHQFLAGSYLVAELGQHPYVDFPYFHMPNLVYIYALLFRITEYPFLAARLLVALCGVGICLAAFRAAWTSFRARGHWTATVLGVSGVALITHSPLFQSANSHVWNHTPATLCALLAFLAHCRGIRSASWRLFFVSGLLLGASLGIRLSFASLTFPFLAAMLVLPPQRNLKSRVAGIAAFAGGGLLANVPALYFLAAHSGDFIFGNFISHSLSPLYHTQMNRDGAMTLLGKLRFLRDVVLEKPADLLILFFAVFGAVLLIIGRNRGRIQTRLEVPFLLLCLPFLLAGSLAPTPSWYQYFFAPMPFLLLFGLYSLASIKNRGHFQGAVVALVLAALVSVAFSSPIAKVRYFTVGLDPEFWYPIQVHRAAADLARLARNDTPQSKILTFAPLYAIEGKLPIFNSFATGPFAWRISRFLSAEERAERSIVGAAELSSVMRDIPPAAIVTGVEQTEIEASLIKVAEELGYVPVSTSAGTVWVCPEYRDQVAPALNGEPKRSLRADEQ